MRPNMGVKKIKWKQLNSGNSKVYIFLLTCLEVVLVVLDRDGGSRDVSLVAVKDDCNGY